MFTPAKWDSIPGGSEWNQFHLHAEDSPPKKSGLKSSNKDKAIDCFGYNICVAHNCNANHESDTFTVGRYFINDPGLYERTFFTGTTYFQVKKTEVFEVTH
jgi:hypothetical protein